tara:strand:+ start:25471 stop:25782 length:312 start_codon:yes stop_codon:yes gene_type:complete
MDVDCQNKKLLKLYETGKSTNKYRLTQEIIDNFVMRVDALISAKNIYDLWNHPALNFEKLKGANDKFSLRLNNQYRLEISIEWTNKEKTVGKINVLDISNHYS